MLILFALVDFRLLSAPGNDDFQYVFPAFHYLGRHAARFAFSFHSTPKVQKKPSSTIFPRNAPTNYPSVVNFGSFRSAPLWTLQSPRPDAEHRPSRCFCEPAAATNRPAATDAARRLTTLSHRTNDRVPPPFSRRWDPTNPCCGPAWMTPALQLLGTLSGIVRGGVIGLSSRVGLPLVERLLDWEFCCDGGHFY